MKRSTSRIFESGTFAIRTCHAQPKFAKEPLITTKCCLIVSKMLEDKIVLKKKL